MILGLILFFWAWIPLEGLNVSFVEAMSVGATLSATDPVTILAIFNTYKVDPKLYTVIFGEAILNDAIAIVLFETAQKYKENTVGKSLTIFTLFESIGVFLGVFFGSLVIGTVVGVATSLMLKFTLVRRFPKIESCLIILIAYASYFFSNAIHMSGKSAHPTFSVVTTLSNLGIVSLLFCGICMKHYAYHNMSRRTQLTTKFIFQILAQLAENFIFIYLGLSLFTERNLEYKPLFILVTVAGICVARWAAVFPLSRLINWFIRYRARRKGKEVADELPYSHQAMLFWAGLRGAVGVALAAGLTGPNASFLRATVLVVVVLTVIIFGGTTARMLEILGIRTGVVEEIDSDDEFDIEVVGTVGAGRTYARKLGTGFGHVPRAPGNGVALANVNGPDSKRTGEAAYSSGSTNGMTPPQRPDTTTRRNSTRSLRNADGVDQSLLSPESSLGDLDDADLDLPPAAPRSVSPRTRDVENVPYPLSGSRPTEGGQPAGTGGGSTLSATGTIRQLISGVSEDPATLFRQIDEGFIKPHLLLDPGKSNGRGSDAV